MGTISMARLRARGSRWLPYVGLGLALVAGLIAEYQHDMTLMVVNAILGVAWTVTIIRAGHTRRKRARAERQARLQQARAETLARARSWDVPGPSNYYGKN